MVLAREVVPVRMGGPIDGSARGVAFGCGENGCGQLGLGHSDPVLRFERAALGAHDVVSFIDK